MSFLDALLGRKHPPTIGLDISSSSVKLVELGLNKAGDYVLERFASEPFEKGWITDGQIEKFDEVADAVRRVVAKSGSRTKQVVMAMPQSAVITKKIMLPAGLREEELERDVGLAEPPRRVQARGDAVRHVLGAEPAAEVQVGDPGERRQAGAAQHHGVDPAERRRAPAQVHVRGRKTDGAAELLAMRNAPVHGIRPPEQARGLGEFAGRQPLADARAADAHAIDQVRGGVRDLEPGRRTAAFEQRVVALAAVAEAEVVADHEEAHAETVDQQVLHEIAGAHRREPGIEGQHQHALHAGGFERDQLLAQPRQPRRRLAARRCAAASGKEVKRVTYPSRLCSDGPANARPDK